MIVNLATCPRQGGVDGSRDRASDARSERRGSRRNGTKRHDAERVLSNGATVCRRIETAQPDGGCGANLHDATKTPHKILNSRVRRWLTCASSAKLRSSVTGY